MKKTIPADWETPLPSLIQALLLSLFIHLLVFGAPFLPSPASGFSWLKGALFSGIDTPSIPLTATLRHPPKEPAPPPPPLPEEKPAPSPPRQPPPASPKKSPAPPTSGATPSETASPNQTPAPDQIQGQTPGQAQAPDTAPAQGSILIFLPDEPLHQEAAVARLTLHFDETGKVNRVEFIYSELPPAYEKAVSDAFTGQEMSSSPWQNEMTIEIIISGEEHTILDSGDRH